MEKQFVESYSDFINEAERYHTTTEKTEDLYHDFEDTPEGRDLRDLGVTRILERDKLKLERRNRNESMPRTAVFKGSDGKFHIEHYSSKPGLEVYGKQSFDTTKELYRYLWVKLAKNIIPASLMSRREVEKRINFDELFPIGSGVSQSQFLDRLKPVLGGEELAHPTNAHLLEMPEAQKLIDLSLIGKPIEPGGRRNNKSLTLVNDISKNAKIKYKMYCSAAQTVKAVYGNFIKEIIGEHEFNGCAGTITGANPATYETWTVTNTNRIPKNSVNYRTGENTAKCNVQENDHLVGVFLSIIQRTFRRAKGKNHAEAIIRSYGYKTEIPEIIEEINNLMSDFLFDAAVQLRPSVFIEAEFRSNEHLLLNAKALLIQYFIDHGSAKFVEFLKSKKQLEDYIEYSAKNTNIDDISRKLIRITKSLKVS